MANIKSKTKARAKDIKRARTNEHNPIRIINCSNQMIPVQLSAEGEDFFRGQQQIQLQSGKDVLIDEKYLIKGQAENLQQRGLLKLIKPTVSE
jgi:hypothetical protein